MKTPITFSTALISTLCICGFAVAQTPVGFNNKTLSTAFSGKSNATKRILSKSYDANAAITGLSADEDSDDPCYLELKYADVVARQAQTSIKFVACAGKNGEPRSGIASARRDLNLTGGVWQPAYG